MTGLSTKTLWKTLVKGIAAFTAASVPFYQNGTNAKERVRKKRQLDKIEDAFLERLQELEAENERLREVVGFCPVCSLEYSIALKDEG